MESLVISLFETAYYYPPLAGIFSMLVRNAQMGVSLIWWAFPITEMVSCFVGYVFFKRESEKIKSRCFEFKEELEMVKRIITISREFGSGGRFIGEELAKKIGIRLL